MTARLERRLFIDHSHTSGYGFRTGVQRVVRNICKHATMVQHRFAAIHPVVWTPDGFVLKGIVDSEADVQGKSDVRKRASIVRKVARILGFEERPGKERPTVFRKNDILLLADAYWAYPQIWPSIKSLRAQGVRTIVIIHDLIPHTHSHIYGEQGAEGFRNYVRLACSHADALIGVSETVRRQLHIHLPEILSAQPPSKIASFRLGADFQDMQDMQSHVRPELKALMGIESTSLSKPYLMIGTIEARKNHTYVLKAFDLLWSKDKTPRLCIVGQPGWKGEQFIEELLAHPKYGKLVFWFQDASDAEVAFSYRNSKAVLFPSLTEGFGLPIVESLWYQRPTFASDIEIHREVGMNLCHYFNLSDPADLAKKIQDFDAEPHRFIIRETSDFTKAVLPWSEAVERLLKTIDDLLVVYDPSAIHSSAA